jgi:PAS domain-containing protein
MDATETGVLLLDDRRVLVAANEAAAELLGVDAAEVVGRRADEFMPMVGRQLYPLAWKGFVLRGNASGEYAAQRADGTLARLAYVGFAHRPLRGLHFFVLQPLPGEVDREVLRPRMQADSIQVGADLPEELRQRLSREADREEWRLPVARGGERAIVAALFDGPETALDALGSLRGLAGFVGGIASAAGATLGSPLTLVAGRVAYEEIGAAMEAIRTSGGRVMTQVDERRA